MVIAGFQFDFKSVFCFHKGYIRRRLKIVRRPEVKPDSAKAHKLLAVFLAVAMLTFTFAVNVESGYASDVPVETQRFVHNYTIASGSGTYIEKPVFPVQISNVTIPIGESYTIICPLVADYSYHVYCYGDWVHTGPEPKTDYDIYVYNPQGTLESTHTEAAGLPEHLGTTVDAPYFTPEQSGNYTFVLTNDARESSGSEPATFMLIQHLDCDQWYTQEVKGKSGSQPQLQTSWAYEFVTNSTQIEVYVKVPDTLDMYEARLYLMSDTNSTSINSTPLPWEPGLYGNITVGSIIGGYNLESEGYRGVAYASCEHLGQDMYMKYVIPTTNQTTVNGTKNLFHLVLMGEVGEGTIDFLVKTNFGGGLTANNQIIKITPDDEVKLSYDSSTNPLRKAFLQYSTNDWASFTETEMAVDNRTCNATIPKQSAGTTVKYKVTALDTLENNLTATGEYIVKLNVIMSGFDATPDTVLIGNNITFTGNIGKEAAGETITVQVMSAFQTEYIETTAGQDGSFTAQFTPNATGTWTAQANYKGNNKIYETNSPIIQFESAEPNLIQKNSLIFGVGFIGVVAAFGAVVYIKNKRS